MRIWMGLVLFAAAAGFLAAAWAHRRHVLAVHAGLGTVLPGEGAETGPSRSLAGLGEVARPIVLGLLVYAGIKTSLVYLAFDAGRVLSPFDLAGFLALLAGYGTWFHVRIQHRLSALPAHVHAAVETAAAAVGELQGGRRDGRLLWRDRGDAGVRHRSGGGPARSSVGPAPARAKSGTG